MRRHAAHIFNNRRRGEWNPLLLVMFALLTVTPSVLAAAPIHNAATQPQAVWQWLSECGVAGCPLGRTECGISEADYAIKQCLLRTPVHEIDSPVPQNSAVQSTLEKHHKTDAVWPFFHSSLVTRHSSLVCPTLRISHFAFALSSHEAAKLSGIRTNRFRN